MRIVVFSSLTHTGGLAVAALREVDPSGKFIVIEPTVEKSAAARKQYPWAEVLKKNPDEFLEYLKENAELIDVFVACSDSDAINYRFCRAALDLGVPLVIPVLNNPLNRELFQRSGISMIIDPYASIRQRLLEALRREGEIPLYESLNSQVVLHAYRPREKVRLEAKAAGVVLLTVKADGTVKSGVEQVEKDETLYILGAKADVAKYLEGIRTAHGKRTPG